MKDAMNSGALMLNYPTIVHGLLSIVVIVGCCVGSGCEEAGAPHSKSGGGSTMKKTPTYPGTVRVPFPGERRNVVVDNPRNKGRHEYVSLENGSRGNTRSNPAEIEIWDYRVGMVQFVQLKGGSIVPPVMLVKYPSKRGYMGSIIFEDSWSVEKQFVVPYEAPDDGWADFPISDDIEKYILLLKTTDEETGWRVLELKPSEITDVETVKIPDLMTLPPLEKHPDEKKLWKLHKDAQAEEDKLKFME